MKTFVMIILFYSSFLFAQKWVIGTIKELGAEMKDSSGNILFSNKENPDILKIGDTIRTCSTDNGVKNEYHNIIGVIDNDYIHYSKPEIIILNKELEKSIKKLDLRLEKTHQDSLKKITKEFGKKFAKDIYDGNIRLGMSKKMIIEIMGEPEKINRTVGRWGVYEQWVYGDRLLYFENNKLTSWQD